MAVITIVLGALLILLGLAGYAWVDFASRTAMIPAILGVVFVILGVLALKPKFRKHAMHVAAMVGLIGFVGAAVRVVPMLFHPIASGPPDYTLQKFVCQLIASILCAIFVGLCVKSFIDARRRRTAQAEAGTP